jgi:glycosyltransferase involved in cell wall biosynthesis
MHSKMRNSIYQLNKKQRIETIWPGVDQSQYSAIPAESRKEDYFWTGRVSTFSVLKTPLDWIKWCSTIVLKKPIINEWIGNGRQLPYMIKQRDVWDNNRNKVILRGGVSTVQKRIAIVKKWHFFLYGINGTEGISMAMLESLASGVPVLCSNHWGNKAIIRNGVNGHIFSNYKEAEEWLGYYIKHPESYNKLVATTIDDFSKRLDIRYVVKSYLSLADGLLSNRR